MSIIVYSKNNCAQCNMLKKQLNAKEIPFEEINLDEQPEYINTVKEMGFNAAPVLVHGDFSFYGFNPGKLKELEARVKE